MRTLSLGWSVIQLPIVLMLCMNFPEPQITLYSVTSNNTVVSNDMGLSPLYIGNSFAVMMFGMLSMQLFQDQVFDNMSEFSNSITQALASWNVVFWGLFLLFHFLMVAQVTSPVDLYCIGFIVMGQYLTVHFLCKPRDMYRGYENMAFVLYLIFCLLTYSEMHTKHGMRLFVITLSLVADLLLVTGHTYDDTTNTETVGNCRLFYANSVGVLLIVLYFCV